MAELTCLDGRVLAVQVEPVLARDGVPYEVVLRLLLQGAPIGEVGERCAWQLGAGLRRLRTGPDSAIEAAVRGLADGDAVWAALAPYLPPDRPLLELRSRTPDDLPGTGELRVSLRTSRRWADGRWQVRERAVVDAWGSAGAVRGELDRAALTALLHALVSDCAGLGVLEPPAALEEPDRPADNTR